MTKPQTTTTWESFVGHRSFHSSTVAPRPAGPALGTAVASVGARAAMGVMTKAAKLRAAQSAYRGVTTESFRTRVRRFVIGSTWTGSAARAAGLATVTGTAMYAILEPVPATGRWRLMMFDHDTEAELMRPSVSRLFQLHWHRFLPPGDPRVQRVAAVLWKLVNRLDPSLVVPAKDDDTAAADADAAEGNARRRRETAAKKHLMLREGSHWTVHVIDTPEVNAFVAPGGHIFVHTGLLRAVGRDDNMLAFVLAHEMGHQLARHSAEKATLEMLRGVYQTGLWCLAATLGAGGEDFFGGVFLAGALIGAEAATEVAVSLPYSRTMEHEADDLGMRIMSRACFDPGAGPRVMRMFQHYEDRAKQLATNEAAAGEAPADDDEAVNQNPRRRHINASFQKWKEKDARRVAEVGVTSKRERRENSTVQLCSY